MVTFRIDGVIAHASNGTHLEVKMTRLLNLHARYRGSVSTVSRLPSVALAINALRARMTMLSDERKAA